jgi:hypothetical protein
MPSNVVHTCIPCRFSAKQTGTCPYCHQPMTYMGKAFKPPRKTNHSQWRKVEMLVGHDIRFGYCSCHRLNRAKMRTPADAKGKCEQRRVHKKNFAPIKGDPRAEQIRRRKAWKAELYAKEV